MDIVLYEEVLSVYLRRQSLRAVFDADRSAHGIFLVDCWETKADLAVNYNSVFNRLLGSQWLTKSAVYLV